MANFAAFGACWESYHWAKERPASSWASPCSPCLPFPVLCQLCKSGQWSGLVPSPEAGRTSCMIQGFITLSESQSCLLPFFFCPYAPSVRAQSLESLRIPVLRDPTGQRTLWSRFVITMLLSHLLLPQHSGHGLRAVQNLWSRRAWECLPFCWTWQPQAVCGCGEVRDLVGWSGGFQPSKQE